MNILLWVFLLVLASWLPAEACQPYHAVHDRDGNAVPGNATLSVYAAGTTTLSTVYSDSSCATIKPNPIIQNGGTWSFWANDGVYDLIFALANIRFSNFYNVSLIDDAAAGNLFYGEVDFRQLVPGVPQILLEGAQNNEYTTLRSGGTGGAPDGSGGDFFVQPTGSTSWFQTRTSNFPTTIEIVPKGTQATNAANLELYGTDWLADGTNYERLRISANGSAGTEHEIVSDHGGSVSALPLHIYVAGVNGFYMKPDGTNGLSTTTPRRKFDILDGSGNAQFRLSYSDNTKYTDFKVESDGTLSLVPISNAARLINGTTPQSFRVYGTTSGDKYVELSDDGTDGVVNVSAGKLVLGSSGTSVVTGSPFAPVTVAFSTLPGSPVNSWMVYCSDCTIANPCAGGGTGAFAKRINGAWVCN